MVQESFAWFTGLVAERRHLTPERVAVLADGRVYTGRQAVTEKLIDALGGEDVALDWLETEPVFASLGKDWEAISPSSLNALQTGIERHVAKALWDPLVLGLLKTPAFAAFAVFTTTG